MSTQPLQSSGKPGRPPTALLEAIRKFVGSDRWADAEQSAIDISGQTRQFTTPEHVILTAIDLGLREIRKDIGPHEPAEVERKPKAGKEHK